MRIKNISLKNYRNIEAAYIDFSDGINILIGENANGKTNAVEAIYQFAQGKSFRTKNNTESISFDKEMCDLSLGFVYPGSSGPRERQSRNKAQIYRYGDQPDKACLFIVSDRLQQGPDPEEPFIEAYKANRADRRKT
jgi:DNA replication and repair protein RecF